MPQFQDGARAPPCTSLPVPLSMHLQVNCTHVYTESSNKNAPICNARYFERKANDARHDVATHSFIHLLTQWSKVPFDKPVVSQLVKKLPHILGIPNVYY